MYRHCHAFLLSLGLATAAAAGTESDEDRLVINRIDATDFEVVQMHNMDARAFWCGAASLLERREGRPGTTPIYLKSPRGPSVTAPGRKAVVFTTDPTGLEPQSDMYSVNVRQPGQMLKAYEARGFCRDAFNRSTK
jgi:hypothetical protein